MIIGFSGLARVGKDTAADYLVSDYGFVKVALADPIKRIARDVYNFSYEQLWGDLKDIEDERYPRPIQGLTPTNGVGFLTPRHALEILGTEAVRHCYENTWVDLTIRTSRKLLNDKRTDYTPTSGISTDYRYPLNGYKGVIIPDVRFKNEIDAIHNTGGRVYRIKKAGTKSPTQHISQTGQLLLGDEQFDGVLENESDIHSLYSKVDILMNRFPTRI